MTEALVFRDAVEADLPVVLRLLADDDLGRAREDLSEPLNAAYRAAFEAITVDPNQRLVVAERGGGVIGTLQLSFLPGLSHQGAWRAQIEAVRVDSALRGQGLGRQMIDWAVEVARTRGCRMVQLTSNASRSDAHRFYEGLGFAKSHAGFKRVL
ncbi:N-acetyltransferase family protein [Primorskyibacter sp. 2E107]|uniref:GNAT family N-acetyltransferase n=1 Tax=Primorskyibacter sp. 2E107 TaxID=3403458 RepID=UPI003AF415B9